MSKLNLNTLEDYIHDNFDVLCLSETKLDELDEPNIVLEGYTPITTTADTLPESQGALPLLLIQTFPHLLRWKSLAKTNISNGYIPPSDSPYTSGDEFNQIMSDIIDIDTKYNNCKICLVGDFNARTGNLPDFIEADKHLLHATGLDEGDTDIFMDRNMFEHLNIVADRYTTDKVIDATGKKLLDFCSNTCMLIVNDRTGKKSSGGATCKGVSTIDYAIASSDLFKHINDFHIDIFDKCLSDIHSPIYLELNSLLCTDFPEPNINQENVTSSPVNPSSDPLEHEHKTSNSLLLHGGSSVRGNYSRGTLLRVCPA